MKLSLLSSAILAFALTACQSSFKTSDRNPAQSPQGTGEIGSVQVSIHPLELSRRLDEAMKSKEPTPSYAESMALYEKALSSAQTSCQQLTSHISDQQKFENAKKSLSDLANAYFALWYHGADNKEKDQILGTRKKIEFYQLAISDEKKSQQTGYKISWHHSFGNFCKAFN